MRIAIVYDCLYPCTVGGAERWLATLAPALGADHEVTYVTRRQWRRGEAPSIAGVRVTPVAPGGDLYASSGRRRLLPPLVFALGVFAHMARHRRSYDVVDCLSFPYFPLLAVRLALLGAHERPVVFCQWLEFWSPDYWRRYLGRLGGTVGCAVQLACLKLTTRAFVFSRMHEGRLREAGYRGPIRRLGGLLEQRPQGGGTHREGPPLVLFTGRHIPEKQPALVPDVVSLAQRSDPALTACLVGDGPERGRVLERIAALGLDGAVRAPGFVDDEELDRLRRQASCLLFPSVREGHGIAVAEAAAAGLPVVVCRTSDNAATELVEEGVNGAIAESPAAEDLSRAVLRVLAGGEELRRSTLEWFTRHAEQLSAHSSVATVRATYGQAVDRRDA